ncbi:Type IV secretion system protein PtlE [Erwinia aphidicola]|uniref:type IV secretion system protein n=1 Tax=Erwinia aphidicola TaxID=68334 RepID=UPI001D2A1653|nr:type IV secretion system protein [Erwinia aphidicola]CAH0298116.1 Type IV secretion system protein PtlE [Erwinia aphidicola]
MLGIGKKVKKDNEREHQLVYGDGPLEGKQREVASIERTYQAAAKWFEARVAEDYKKKAKSSKRLAIFLGVLLAMSLIANMSLSPLKTVEPFVIRVDKNSGYVDIVKPSYSMSDSSDVAEDKHFISAYVLAHESYNWSSQRANYAFIQLTSSEDVFTPYKNFQLSKKGYAEKLGMQQQVKTEINSIVALPRSKQEKLSGGDSNIRSYQVRYSQTLLMADGRAVVNADPINWISIITINNSNPPKTEGNQWLNPKGYLVVGWEPTLTNAGSNQ